jgi:hypothetical protein
MLPISVAVAVMTPFRIPELRCNNERKGDEEYRQDEKKAPSYRLHRTPPYRASPGTAGCSDEETIRRSMVFRR